MNITLRQIDAFLAVSRTLSFSHAAALVHLSQPALSANIRRLEDEIGARLFDRDTRTVALSAVGKEFLQIAVGISENIDSGLSRIQGYVSGKRGRLLLAVAPSLATSYLPAIIVSFSASHPDVELRLHDELSDTCIDMVRSGHVDLALTPQRADADDLMQRVLFRDYLVVVCSAKHPLAKCKEVLWTDIQKYDHIAKRSGSSVRQLIDAEYSKSGTVFRPAFEVEHLGTMLGLIVAGLGIGVLPFTTIQSISMPGLVYRSFSKQGNPYRTICAVTARVRSTSPIVENFLTVCAERSKEERLG
ncbi:MAG TPA: LysR family transcriptional regulator [Eoetvoesiella sp.]